MASFISSNETNGPFIIENVSTKRTNTEIIGGQLVFREKFV